MNQTLVVPMYELGVGNAVHEGDLSGVVGEAVFVVPEMAWAGLHDLSMRALGQADGFTLPGVGDLTPLEAAGQYDWSTGMMMAQQWVEGPDFGRHTVDSIASYAQGGGDLQGLEGLLLSAAFTAHRDGGGEQWLDKAAGVLQDNLGDRLGAGREIAGFMDAASKTLGGLDVGALKGFAESGGAAGVDALRGAVHDLARPSGSNGGGGGHGDSGGGFLTFLGGVVMAGIGLAVSAVCPPAGELLVVGGVGLVADGLKGGHHEDHPAVRQIDVHSERITTVTEHPDGTRTTTVREIHHTTAVMVEGRPKDGHGHGGHDKLWDDSGGGFDDSGNPIPIDPAAVLWCPPADEFDGTIVGPRRNDVGLIEDYGPYAALEAILEAPSEDGTLDVDQLFAEWTMTEEGVLIEPTTVDVVDLGLLQTDAGGTGRRAFRVAPDGGREVVVIVDDGTDMATAMKRAVEQAEPLYTARNQARAIRQAMRGLYQ